MLCTLDRERKLSREHHTQMLRMLAGAFTEHANLWKGIASTAQDSRLVQRDVTMSTPQCDFQLRAINWGTHPSHASNT